ncbi:MAG: hypothetical protein H8D22_07470 [Candidatus Cloacimonetes bacterium]|nr:hypothetical protein [Candidatus Cloacimonadota bacterium]
MWIGGYAANPGGMTILEPDGFYHLFEPKVLFPEGGQNHATMLTVLLQEEKVWLGCYHTGIQYWDGQGFPQTYQAGDTLTLHWHSFAGAEGKSCFDFDVQRTNYGNYIFAGCIDGLYMYDEDWDDWYKFTSGLAENVKQYYWDGSEWEKQDWGYYWIGETRLGSGIYNMINDVFVDPHGRKWLATNGGGISMLDETNYYFTNFNTENSDLCSDVVLSFAYNPYTGKLFAGTSEGLCSFDIGASKKDELASRKVKKLAVYPNPFKPAEHNYIYFQAEPDKNLPTGKNKLYIYNLTGELVAVLNESDLFRFFWDGRNKAGKPVASGIYFWVLSSQFDDVYLNGKFAVIR